MTFRIQYNSDSIFPLTIALSDDNPHFATYKSMKSIFFGAVSFASEPLLALVDSFKRVKFWASYKPPSELIRHQPAYVKSSKLTDDGKPIYSYSRQGHVTERIRNLVVRCGLPPERILIQVVCDDYYMAASNSVKNGHQAVIAMSESVLTRVTSPDFSDDHGIQFAIAHELMHLVADDSMAATMIDKNIANIIRITSYSVICIALQAFFPLRGSATHFIGCSLAKFSGFISFGLFARAREWRADCMAIKRFPDLREGGVKICKESQEMLLLMRSKMLQTVAVNAKKQPWCLRGLVTHCQSFYIKIKISSTGENRFQIDHPSFAARIKNILMFKP